MNRYKALAKNTAIFAVGTFGSKILSFIMVFFYSRAMQTAERFYSHREVVAAIEEEFGKALEFSTCAKSSEAMLRIRERVNQMIKKAVCKH